MERIRVDKYYNEPQAEVALVNATNTTVVAGRGLGKTTIMAATKFSQVAHSMPRCTINIYQSTYRQFMVTTGKELFLGLNQLNWQEGVHYVYRKAPPKSWPKPYRMPLDPSFSIFCYNGTVAQVLSEDVFLNGSSAQFMIGDEARKFDPAKYVEISLAMRDDSQFPDNPDFMGEWLFTDQPQSPVEAWVLEHEKQMDKKQVELIKMLQLKCDSYKIELLTAKEEKHRAYLEKKVKWYEAQLWIVRKNSYFFLEASTLKNVHALGIDYINKQKRLLTDQQFRRSILNERIRNVERAFFPTFDRFKHSYYDFDYSYLDSLGIIIPSETELTAKQDKDILPFKGFQGSIDTGGTISCMVFGQDHGNVYRIPRVMHVDPPYGPKDLAKSFARTYKHHLCKQFRFIYDQTQNQENYSHIKACNDFIEGLREEGWEVYPDYDAVVPSYESRHIFFHKAFAGEYKGIIPDFQINRTHCENLIIGLETAGIFPGHKDPYKIDKRPERNKKLDQSKTTHYPEAMMCLLYSLFASRVNGSGFSTSMYK